MATSTGDVPTRELKQPSFFSRHKYETSLVAATVGIQALGYLSGMPSYSGGDFGLGDILGIYPYGTFDNVPVQHGINVAHHFVGGAAAGLIVKNNLIDPLEIDVPKGDYRTLANSRGVKQKAKVLWRDIQRFSTTTFYATTLTMFVQWEVIEYLFGNPLISMDGVKDLVMGYIGAVAVNNRTGLGNFLSDSYRDLNRYVKESLPKLKAGVIKTVDRIAAPPGMDDLEDDLDE